jgi:hypothetical protein
MCITTSAGVQCDHYHCRCAITTSAGVHHYHCRCAMQALPLQVCNHYQCRCVMQSLPLQVCSAITTSASVQTLPAQPVPSNLWDTNSKLLLCMPIEKCLQANCKSHLVLHYQHVEVHPEAAPPVLPVCMSHKLCMGKLVCSRASYAPGWGW